MFRTAKKLLEIYLAKAETLPKIDCLYAATYARKLKNEIFKKTNQPPTNVSHLRWPKVSSFY